MLDDITIKHIRTGVQRKKTNEYARIAQKLVYQRFVKVLPSDTLEQKFVSLLEAQVIEDFGQDGGGVKFSDQVLCENTYVNHVHKWGGKWSEFKFKDTDRSGIVGGEGIQLIGEATVQSTQKAAYYPQKYAVKTLRSGTSTSMNTDNGNAVKLVCYDGKALFAHDHPYNFQKVGLGTFDNYLVGAPVANTGYPGFLPLAGPFAKNAGTGTWEYSASASVSLEDAWDNLWKMVEWVSTLKMPDGVTPRFLSPSNIICSKRLQKAVVTLLSAKFISMKSGSSGGGSTDIEGSIRALGFSPPTILEELSAAPDLATNEAYDWYIQCEEDQNASEIGAINIGMNMPWNIKVFSDGSSGGSASLELAIEDAVVAVGKMRFFIGVGQPQYIFKSEAPRS